MNPDQFEYAVKLARTGNLPEAARLLRDIVRQQPQNMVAWKWLAYTSTDPREALTAVQTVMQLNPGDQWAREVWPTYQKYAQDAGLTVVPQRRMAVTPSRSTESWVSVMLLGGILLAGALLIVLAGGKLEAVPEVMRGTVVAPLGQAQPALPATVDMSSEVEYYSFEAADLQEIQHALYTQGPSIEEEGEHSIALTNYELWVTWKMAQSVTGCRVDDVIVHLDVTYIYPQWIPLGQPDRALQTEWDRFYQHVVNHEEYHGQIARQCAADLADLLHTYNPGSVCTDAQADLDNMVRDLYASCEARQQAFDVDHGRTTFPLPPTETP